MKLHAILLWVFLPGLLSAAEVRLWGDAWSEFGGVTCAQGVATAAGCGGAHRSFAPVLGTVRFGADVAARGCGFAGLSLGQGNLSGNFWSASRFLIFVANGHVALSVGGKDMTASLKDRSAGKGEWTSLAVEIDTREALMTLKVNGKIVAERVKGPAGVDFSKCDAVGFRFNEPVSAGVPKIRNFAFAAENLWTGGLAPTVPDQYFVEPDRPTRLTWKVASRGREPKLPYEVVGYDGKVESVGEAAFSASGDVELVGSFARGFHEVRFPSANTAFGIVSLEPAGREKDPFFCMDAALTWLEDGMETRERLVSAMARSGIARVRERLALGNFNAERGWEAWRHPVELRKLYAKYGMKTLEMQWGATGAMAATPGRRIALDGVRLDEAWVDARNKLDFCWDAYEIGNEADLENFPADQYVSSVKAGVQAQDPSRGRLPVAAGVFATVPPGDWYACALRNGLADVVDAVTFHQYDRAPSIEGQVSAMREWLRQAGCERRPILLTESGHSWRLGPNRPPAEQDIESAGEISAKAVEAKACGVREFYPFVLPFYEEGGAKNFGMFGREASPLRQYAAYSFCIRALSFADPVGDLVLEGADRARVFRRPDGSFVATVYSGEAGRKVRLPGSPRQVTGADGRTLSPHPDGTYSVSDLLVYAFYKHLPASAVKSDTSAMKLCRLGQTGDRCAVRQSPLVLRYLWPEDARMSKRSYRLSSERARQFTFEVEAQNLGSVPLTYRPVLTTPDGVEHIHAPVTVSVRGVARFSWHLDVAGCLDVLDVRYLDVTGTVDGGEAPVRLSVPLLMDGELQDFLGRFGDARRLPVGDCARWKMRKGPGEHKVAKGAEGGVLMDLQFKNRAEAWVYPYFKLPEPIDEHRFQGVIVKARVAKPATMVSLLFADEARGYEIWAGDVIPDDGQWHCAYVPFAGLRYRTAGMQNASIDFQGISSLSFGFCSRGNDNVLEVGELILVGSYKNKGKVMKP